MPDNGPKYIPLIFPACGTRSGSGSQSTLGPVGYAALKPNGSLAGRCQRGATCRRARRDRAGLEASKKFDASCPLLEKSYKGALKGFG
jgi:hypothetical protein